MKQTMPVQFVRSFHRWTGILLIGFMAVKILSGASIIKPSIHYEKWVDIPLFFLFISHAAYGLFKIIQGKVSHRIGIFWVFNIIILIIFLCSLVFIVFR